MRNNAPRMKTPTPEQQCPESWHPWALFSGMVGMNKPQAPYFSLCYSPAESISAAFSNWWCSAMAICRDSRWQPASAIFPSAGLGMTLNQENPPAEHLGLLYRVSRALLKEGEYGEDPFRAARHSDPRTGGRSRICSRARGRRVPGQLQHGTFAAKRSPGPKKRLAARLPGPLTESGEPC